MSSRRILPLLLLAAASVSPVAAAEGDGPGFLWAEAQPRGGRIAGSADLDGQPGAEIVVAGLTGGFTAVRGDGSVLWRYPAPGWSRPAIAGDLDADGHPDVVAQVGFPKMGGRLVALSGPTGEPIFERPVHSPVGSARAGDLDADGDLDLVVPSVDGAIKLMAFLAPDFTHSWTATLPGTMDAYWVFAESIDIGDLDGDGAAEVVFGTRLSGNSGGKIVVLDGRTGATRWTADTGSVFSVRAVGTRVVAFVWRPAGITFRAELVGYAAAGGAPLWTTPTPGFVKSGPMLVADVDGAGGPEAVVATGSAQEGTLFFGLDPSNQVITAVGAADGVVRWTAKVVRDVSSLVAMPRGDGGSDVLYGTDGWLSGYVDEYVGRLDGRTGAQAWLHVHSGDAYDEWVGGIAHADVDGTGGPEVVYAHPEQKLTALSPSDGAVRFGRSHPGVWTAAAAADTDDDGDPDVFGGGGEGLLQAMDESGAARWSVPLGGVVGGVRVAGDAVLVASLGRAARAVALDPATGAQRWSAPAGLAANSPFSVHQQAFGDLDGDGTDDVVIGGHQQGRPAVVALSGRTGTLLWRALSPVLPPGIQPAATVGQVVAVGVAHGDVLAVIQGSLEHDVTPRLVLIDGATGRPAWSTTDAADAQDATVLPLGSRILVGHGDEILSAREPAGGAEAWALDLGEPHVLLPWEGKVLALGRASAFVKTFQARVIGAAGQEAAAADPGLPPVQAAAIVPDVGLAAATAGGVFVIDPQRLAAGEVKVLQTLHLPVFTNLNGTTFEVPTVSQVVAGKAGSGRYAVGLRDPSLALGGSGGGIAGAWLARLDDPTPSAV